MEAAQIEAVEAETMEEEVVQAEALGLRSQKSELAAEQVEEAAPPVGPGSGSIFRPFMRRTMSRRKGWGAFRQP